MMNYYILGISAFYHDSAAALIKDGQILAAAQEERFTRLKHDQHFPGNAIRYCLQEAGITINQLSYVVFYDKPFVKFNRILETSLHAAPKGILAFMKGVPQWLSKKLWIPDIIRKETGYRGEILFTEHHEAHAASAFFPSPFHQAAFLTMDGVGEWATSSFGIGEENRIQILSELHFPHSLGLLYSAFTYFTGFKVNSGEYKLMGLAPYGRPRYVQKIYEHLIDLKEDGSFKLNLDYFNYTTGLTMTHQRFSKLFDGKPRQPEAPLTQREMDLARSIQEVTEEIVLRMARQVKRITGQRNLCLAGGVALNCVANGKLLNSGIFDRMWIQPAAGDAGGALGAAFTIHHHYLKQPRSDLTHGDIQKGSYLGPSYSQPRIETFLKKKKAVFHSYSEQKLLEETVRHLISGKVVGWFQGRMEFGPRALGNRSILGDARQPQMQKRINLKVKFRESFRPFAPSVLAEEADKWFRLNVESPYMLLVADVHPDKLLPLSEADRRKSGLELLDIPRSQIPAVTHVDGTARIQTVRKENNPLYYKLLRYFFKKTGCPVLINTSFNVRGEPIVESPEQAYHCFIHTDMDVLILGRSLLVKSEQMQRITHTPPRNRYEPD